MGLITHASSRFSRRLSVSWSSPDAWAPGQRKASTKVALVSETSASFSFCCLVSQSAGDGILLFVCLRFGV